MKNWKFWDFVGWDNGEVRNEREQIRGKWSLYTTLVTVVGLCVFAYIVWGG